MKNQLPFATWSGKRRCPDRRLGQLTHFPTIDALRNDPAPAPRRYRARTEVVLEVWMTDVEVLLDHQIPELLDELRIVGLIAVPSS